MVVQGIPPVVAEKFVQKYSLVELGLDSITGLPMRHFFQTHLECVLQLGHSAMVVMGDVCGLHTMNTKLGRNGGNQALITAGETLAQVNAMGYAYRTGGDEFATIADRPLSTGDHVTDTELQKSLEEEFKAKLAQALGTTATAIPSRVGLVITRSIIRPGDDYIECLKQMEEYLEATKPLKRREHFAGRPRWRRAAMEIGRLLFRFGSGEELERLL